MLAASSFNVGVSLLPLRLQSDARRLYYLLRTIDDLVDEGDPRAEERVSAVERWGRGEVAETPETRTLDDLAARYPLSRRALIEFCRGMRHDLSGASIETEADLERYCGQAGGTVGIMLAALLGVKRSDGVEKMATLGSAMQWTNILRDIDEDLERGRVYIAQTTIKRFGLPLPGFREELLRDQIGRADALYAEGQEAISLLRSGRLAMGLSTTLYREILRQIEREGFGRTAGRAKIPAWRKRKIVASYMRAERARLAGSPAGDED